ncbi:MAG TPA: discoidin domain-containing protein [Oscillatoriaceae cyanobacterium]
MRTPRVSLLVAMLVLAACSTPQPFTADLRLAPTSPHYHTLSTDPVAIAGVSADSQLANNPATALADGNLASAWSNGGYRNATAWALLTLSTRASLASLSIKMPPAAGGTSYDVQTSDDGANFTTVLSGQTNTSWTLETKPLPANTSGRYVRIFWHNSTSAPQPHVAIYEVQINGGSGTTGGSPSPTTTPTTSPSTRPTTTPSVTPSALPSPSTMPSSSPSIPVGVTPNPGPGAARGQCLLNGVGIAGIQIQVIGPSGTINTTTDAQGAFLAKGLKPGFYYAHYYNPTDRNKIGYWNSVAQLVNATTGAAWPPVDLYQKGMTNTPAMDSHVGLPMTFTWVPQTQPVVKYWFRVHTHPYTNYKLFYMSAELPGNATSYTWNGDGMLLPLDTGNRYFWGVKWDAGPVGVGGNLYQAVYFH